MSVNPWIVIPAILGMLAVASIWFKATNQLKPGSRGEKINTALFNTVFFVPFLLAVPVVKLTVFAFYPLVNFRAMQRDAGLTVAIFVLVASLPAYALLAVVLLGLFGQIPLY